MTYTKPSVERRKLVGEMTWTRSEFCEYLPEFCEYFRDHRR